MFLLGCALVVDWGWGEAWRRGWGMGWDMVWGVADKAFVSRWRCEVVGLTVGNMI